MVCAALGLAAATGHLAGSGPRERRVAARRAEVEDGGGRRGNRAGLVRRPVAYPTSPNDSATTEPLAAPPCPEPGNPGGVRPVR